MNGLHASQLLPAQCSFQGAHLGTLLALELSETPTTESARYTGTQQVVRGEPFALHTTTPEHLPSGSWLTIHASRQVTADTDLVRSFTADPTTQNADPLRDAIESELEELRNIAVLYGGMFALALDELRPFWWHEALLLWVTDSAYQRLQQARVFTIGPARQAGAEDVNAAAVKVASFLVAERRPRRVAELCSIWLLQSNDMPGESNERFLTCFQCLEALCSLMDRTPLTEDIEGFALLDAALLELPNGPAAALSKFVKRVKGIVLVANLKVRFARLAAKYGGAGGPADVERFRIVVSARNALIHGWEASVPHESDGVLLHQAVHELAVNYLRAVMEETSRQRPVIVTHDPEQMDAPAN